MVRTLLRTSAALALMGAIAAAPALAGPTGMFGSAVDGANIALKNALSATPAPAPKLPDGTLAQVPPVAQQPVGGPQQIGLPTGLTYTLDVSAAYPFGNVGTLGKRWLPGGTDAVAGYGISPNSRVMLNYYELQHYPTGFSEGQVPVYLPPGFPPSPANPGCTDLSGSNANPNCPGITNPINATTKDRFFLAMWEKLINLGRFRGREIPVVFTPTYVSRWSGIAASNGNGDQVPFVAPNGTPIFGENARTAQLYSLGVTVPFLKTPKMFGTFTAAPTWLVHPEGLNQTNHAQIYQILYLEYTPMRGTKVFFEPQSSRDYLPWDPYPEHNIAYFLGASRRIGKSGFVQVVVNEGGPTNYQPYGIKQLNCYALPCSANSVPMIGGTHASQIQLEFGIGSPSVLQF